MNMITKIDDSILMKMFEAWEDSFSGNSYPLLQEDPNNKQFFIYLCEHYGQSLYQDDVILLEHFPNSLREDKEVLLYAYMNNTNNEDFFPEEIKKERNRDEVINYLTKSILKEKLLKQLDTNKENSLHKHKI